MRLNDGKSTVREIIYKCGDDTMIHNIDGSFYFKRIEFRKRSFDHTVIVIHLGSMNKTSTLKTDVKLIKGEKI